LIVYNMLPRSIKTVSMDALRAKFHSEASIF
jgi:hypothetical protein